MLTWLTQNASGIGIVGAAIAFIWSIIRFTLDRKIEFQTRQFEAYHRLIKELVAPDPETKVIWLDRQAAVIFELRHFPRYYEITFRILKHLKEKWAADSEFKWPYLIAEIDLTLNYIEKKQDGG
jgi:hypothetical protein